MQTIVDINPLKPGKLQAYKDFITEYSGPRREDFRAMLNRYGLRTVDVYFHQISGVDFVVVIHQAEDNARELLKNFTSSTHPTEQWFVKQLNDLHYFEPLNGASNSATKLFSFDPVRNK